MNISIFNRYYWIRRFGEQKNVRGYLTSSHEDFAASLHIHPTGTSQQQNNPEGERRLKRLQGHGMTELEVADESGNRKGDLLWYGGEWYECTSCQEYDHTVLSHWNYEFVLVPLDAAGSIDLEEPEGDPEEYAESDAEADTGSGSGTNGTSGSGLLKKVYLDYVKEHRDG